MAWERIGGSSNLRTYRDANSDPAEWVDVTSHVGMGGRWSYSVSLYRFGVGQIGGKMYIPKRKPKDPHNLSPRMIGRIAKEIREAVAA